MVVLDRRWRLLSLVRCIDDAAGAVELLTDVALLDERADAGWQWRHFIRIQSADEARRDEHHQFRLLCALGLALEKRAEDWDLAQNRNRRRIGLADVVEQAGDRERLSVSQLNVSLGAACRERRDPEAFERDAIGEVEGADLRTYLQADEVAGNRRFE